MDLASLFFKPSGRISPQTFWAGFAILTIVSVGVLFIPVVGGLAWLMTLFPWAVLNTKRLHDLGRSGWFQLVQHLGNLMIIAAAIAMLGGAAALSFVQGEGWRSALDAGAALGVVGGFLMTAGLVAFNVLWLVWLGGAPGRPYENRYGRPTNWP
jgi:uncharacterized membrane protein YhaH (DUF805 family)